MYGEAFRDFLRGRIASGQRELASATRMRIERDMPPLREVLDAGGQDAYLEPLLFTYLAEADATVGLPQIVLGYVPAPARPEAIEIDTDAFGRAYLPRIGYFLTEERNASLVLSWSGAANAFHLSREARSVAFRLEPPLIVPGTTLEVARYADPLLTTRFFDHSKAWVGASVAFDGLAERHLDALAQACALLSEHAGEFFADLVSTTRRLVLFEHPDVNSFASLAAHGDAFFNVRPESGAPYFIDELAHQCGHVMFYAATLQRADFLRGDLAARLGDAHKDALDPPEKRSVYGAFHGIFTEYTMIHCLSAVERARVLSSSAAHELFGRLSFIARKARIDLGIFADGTLLTDLGRAMHQHFMDEFRELERARHDLFDTDMGGQPYTFDYRRFARANPMSSGHALEHGLY